MEKDINTKERQIMRCDVLTNTVFDINEVIFLKYLEKYRKLYYNGNREKDVVWLAFLTSKTFEEVDISAEQRENSIIINMLDKNIDISIISEVTGRSIKDIEEIKKSYKILLKCD